MIETVSSPPDLSQWDPREQPFYLELFGETSPVLDCTFTEVIPPGGKDAVSTAPASVYEYWWTLGHPGAAPHREQWGGLLGPEPGEPQAGLPVWENLRDDPAARVYLYFPISGGWRVREIMATVKYLMPVQQQHAWWSQALQDLQVITPLAQGASAVAGLVPGGATASNWLRTVSKLQVGSVPPSKDFPWSVEKVTFGGHGREVMQGVAWNLPASLMRAQGGRVTGSLAVSMFPAARRGPGAQAASPAEPAPRPVKAHAGVYPKSGKPSWIPGPDARGFIDLPVAPKLP